MSQSLSEEEVTMKMIKMSLDIFLVFYPQVCALLSKESTEKKKRASKFLWILHFHSSVCISRFSHHGVKFSFFFFKKKLEY